MRIGFVVQRYGTEVAGGAEAATRMFATALARRGHEIRVVTSCATSYDTWSDSYPPGTTVEEGVEVRRLSVPRPRSQGRFAPLSERVLGRSRVSPIVEAAWMNEQGPTIPSLREGLTELCETSDIVAFMTYLYPTTVYGLPAVSEQRPTVLHPTAHDEPTFRRQVIREVFDRVAGLALFTEEERDLVCRRYRPTCPTAIVPVGVTFPTTTPQPDRFRQRFDIGDDPYLLYLGRIDPNKGAGELLSYFRAFGNRHDDRLRLVMVGAEMMEVERTDRVVVAGFVDEATKWDALAGSVALVQPSHQESFSIALVESWLMERPVIVQRNCAVLDGFTRRARGGIPYGSFGEFEASVSSLLESPDLAATLGGNGRRHVVERFGWDTVIDGYVSFLDEVAGTWRTSRS